MAKSENLYCKLKSVDLDAVRWTEGFWAERFELCKDATIPSIKEALDISENSAVLRNFSIAAGLETGEHRGTNWSDGDCYKWIEAMAHVYNVTGDEDLDRMMDESIEVIGKAQDPDGYICTQIQLTDKERWQERGHHELYNMGHLMTAAYVHHRVTGKDNFLSLAVKLCDYLYDLFQPRPPELALYGWNPSNIMGLVDIYHSTGDSRYLELAGIFVDMRGSKPGGTDQNQNRVPLRNETKAVGHAVTATYLYCGATDVYAETGDKALLEALEQIWDDVVYRKMYITGGVGPLHNSTSIRNDPVHEAFDMEYHLHNSTAYNETCANIGNTMWNWRMFQIDGEAKYADVMEQGLYNILLSGVSIDGKRFFYTNALRWYGEEHELLSQDAFPRWHTFTCYCCPPSVARSIARLYQWAYSVSDDAVWVNIYSGSNLETTLSDDSPLKLTQETLYPWDGHIKITVQETPSEAFALMLRIPAWTSEADIKINGEEVDTAAKAGTYVALKREWSAGDEVELTLPMEAKLVKANPKVEEVKNQVAIVRGPVVYCLESVDLPDDVHISEVHIPRDIQLTPRYDGDLLGGVTVLEGNAYRIPEGDWSGKLYQDFSNSPKESVKITLIPYYAWANRGACEMTVWLPLC
ncbi:glycoside hydrolase family 127 protein [Candidatus Poribacteria bacterium]